MEHPFRPRAVAANLLVRRAAFEQVGGFYEGVRAAEDTDFSWRLQARRMAAGAPARRVVVHRYRTTLGELRRQWRGYAAGRAWLARRYEGFDPQPAVARVLRRALRGAGPRGSLPVGAARRRVRAWTAAAIWPSTLCSRSRSSRGSRCRTDPSAHARLTRRQAWCSWPTVSRRRRSAGRPRPDARTDARVEASARPERVEPAVARALADRLPRGRRRRRADPRSGRAGGAPSPRALRLDLVRRKAGEPKLSELAPAVRPPRPRTPGRGSIPLGEARAGHGGAAGAAGGSRVSSERRSPDARPRRRPVGLHAALRPRAVLGAGACRRATWSWSRAVSPTAQRPSRMATCGASCSTATRRAPPDRALRRAAKLAEHVPDMLRYRALAALRRRRRPLPMARRPVARLLAAPPAAVVLTAHDLLPREPRPGQAAAQRRLYAHGRRGGRALGVRPAAACRGSRSRPADRCT